MAGGDKNIVMIQCVGSRNEEHPYCSRICCSMAVKNALTIKKRNPMRQYLRALPRYQDLRLPGEVLPDRPATPGSSSSGTTRKRRRWFPGQRPARHAQEPRLPRTGRDRGRQRRAEHRDRCGRKDNRQLSDMLKVQLNADGFFLEAHMKLRPVDFATEGIYPLRPGPFAEDDRREYLPGPRRRRRGRPRSCPRPIWRSAPRSRRSTRTSASPA